MKGWPCRRGDGFALLTALVVATLAALFAAVAVAAALARLDVGGADAALSPARRAARAGVEAACAELRWAPLSASGSWQGSSPAAEDPWSAAGSWTSLAPSLDAAQWPVADVRGEGRRGRARAGLRATVRLRQASCAAGLTIGGDADLQAQLSVTGSGVYLLGSLRGREWLAFASSPAAGDVDQPPDGVHGDLWPVAGVHALGGIWATGREEHEGGAAGEPADTDTHTTDGELTAVVDPPSPALLASVAERALDAGSLVVAGALDVARLPSAAGPGSSAVVTLVRPGAFAGPRIVGERAPSADPLVLIVLGDALLGSPGERSSWRGALLVTGLLEVAGETSLEGHLFAGRLLVAAPLALNVPSDWRRRPLSGLAEPVIVALDDG